jgi:hypothetical protein
MRKIKLATKSKIAALSLFAAMGTVGGGLAPMASAHTIMATNPDELLNLVQDTNVGWDWQPHCANGAKWSWGEMRCKGGVSESSYHHRCRHHHHHH